MNSTGLPLPPVVSTAEALASLNDLDVASLAGVAGSYIVPFIAGLTFYGIVLRRPAERLGFVAPVSARTRCKGRVLDICRLAATRFILAFLQGS